MSELTWVVRSYLPGDEEQIIALFEEVFGKPMGLTESAKHWTWEFGENPSGLFMITLAFNDSRVVGQYAVVPLRFTIDGEERLAGLSLDTMVHPDYRRQDMFSITAKALFDDFEKLGAAFVYGFPNKNSIHSFREKLDWRTVMQLPLQVCALRPGRFAAERLGLPVARLINLIFSTVRRVNCLFLGKAHPSIEICEVSDFTWADNFWQRAKCFHRLWVTRDTAYLTWRYSRPESDYRIRIAKKDGEVVGYVVTSLRDWNGYCTLFILDLVVDPSERAATDALVANVLRQGQESSAEIITAIVPRGSPYLLSLKRHLFVSLPKQFFPRELYFGGRLFDVDPALFEDYTSWHLSWGDSDLV